MRARLPGPAFPPRTGEDGFVLISVIAVVLVFAIVSGGIAARSRLQVLAETNRVNTIRFAAEIDGVTRLLAWQAVGSKGQNADGRLVRCRVGMTDLAIRMTDQDGLLDLNGAPPAMLTDVLTAIGIDEDIAKQVANEIVDYRSPPNAAGGPMSAATDADYQQAGLSWGPRRNFFADAQEFAQVPTIATHPDLGKKLLPILTVYNGRAAIDPSVLARAAPELMAAASAKTGLLTKWAAPSRHGRFVIEIAARDPSIGTSFVRQAAVQIGRDGGPEFLKWARLAPGEGSEDVFAARETPDDPSPVCGLAATALGRGRSSDYPNISG